MSDMMGIGFYPPTDFSALKNV